MQLLGGCNGKSYWYLPKTKWTRCYINRLLEDHVHRINEKGVEVQTEHDTYTVEMHATFPEEVNQTYDIIVLLTKSMQSEQMMQILKRAGSN